MQRRLLWLALVLAIVFVGFAAAHFVRSAAAQKGEMSITGKK